MGTRKKREKTGVSPPPRGTGELILRNQLMEVSKKPIYAALNSHKGRLVGRRVPFLRQKSLMIIGPIIRGGELQYLYWGPDGKNLRSPKKTGPHREKRDALPHAFGKGWGWEYHLHWERPAELTLGEVGIMYSGEHGEEEWLCFTGTRKRLKGSGNGKQASGVSSLKEGAKAGPDNFARYGGEGWGRGVGRFVNIAELGRVGMCLVGVETRRELDARIQMKRKKELWLMKSEQS